MKKYGWEKFPEFWDEVSQTFDRLIEVNDYVRANEILKVRQNPPIKWLTKEYLRNPLTTIGAIILAPIFVINFLVVRVAFLGEHAEYLWAGVLAFHLYLIWTMYKPMISERFCDLPRSRRLYKKLVFYRTLFLTVIGYAGFSLFSANVEGIPEDLGGQPYVMLGLGCMVGVASFLVVVSLIRPKVQSVLIAIRRASYFCSVEYLKAFWIVIAISIMLYIIGRAYPCLEQFMVMSKIGDNSSETWYWPNRIEVFKFAFNFSVVLALSFLAPVAGAWKFIKEAIA